MVPNPKTKRGQLGVQVLHTLMIGLPSLLVLVCLLLLLFGIIDDDMNITLVICAALLVYSLPFLLVEESSLLAIRRLICIRTNPPSEDRRERVLSLLYVGSLVLSLVALGSFLISWFTVTPPWGYIFLAFVDLLCLATILALEIVGRRERKKKGIEPVRFAFCLYKKPLFYVVIVVFLFGLTCIPYSTDRVMSSYNYGQNYDHAYRRTDALAYSLIRVIDSGSGEVIDYKFFPFPLNSGDTPELVDLVWWQDDGLARYEMRVETKNGDIEPLAFCVSTERRVGEHDEWVTEDEKGLGAYAALTATGEDRPAMPWTVMQKGLRVYTNYDGQYQSLAVYDAQGNPYALSGISLEMLKELPSGEWYVVVSVTWRDTENIDVRTRYEYLFRLIVE